MSFKNLLGSNVNRRVSDFIRESRDVRVLDVPKVSGETIRVDIGFPETYIKFSGAIGYDFNLEVWPVGCKLGDKLYLIANGVSGGEEITSTGALVFNNCGPDSPPSSHSLDQEIVIIPFVYDGTNFYGLDYC